MTFHHHWSNALIFRVKTKIYFLQTISFVNSWQFFTRTYFTDFFCLFFLYCYLSQNSIVPRVFRFGTPGILEALGKLKGPPKKILMYFYFFLIRKCWELFRRIKLGSNVVLNKLEKSLEKFFFWGGGFGYQADTDRTCFKWGVYANVKNV